MLYLPFPSTAELKKFSDKLLPKIEKERDKSGLSNEAKNFLTKAKILEILIDEPKKLTRHHHDFIPKLTPTFSIAGFNKYLTIKAKFPNQRTSSEKIHYQEYKTEIEKIKGVFDYNSFIVKDKVLSYELAMVSNRNTCTYCNRLYTNVVMPKDERTKRVNNNTRITRPFFDHWFSKSKYPILGLSFFNLIPSCAVCNSSIKSDADFTLSNYVHPYYQEANQNFSFSYASQTVHENNVKIIATANSKIDRTLKAFKIKEVYDAHSAHELKDLLELRYKYSDNYLNTLFNATFDVTVSKREVYRMIFGVEYDDVNHHKRPFSKFKRDILEKLGIVIP